MNIFKKEEVYNGGYMKYRLYVNGKCKNTRKLTGSIGIGGVIISDDGKEISFSKTLGAGTCCEAQIYAVFYGIEEILKFNDAEDINVYLSNLALVNYLNGENSEISNNSKILAKKLKEYINKLKVRIIFGYFDVRDYLYVSSLAEEAIKL